MEGLLVKHISLQRLRKCFEFAFRPSKERHWLLVSQCFMGLFALLALNCSAMAGTRFERWQSTRPLTLTAWGTHDITSAPNEIDVPYFLGSGLNTAWDGVRSGSSSWAHPNTNGLPSLLMAYQAETPDVQGFIDDFNEARGLQSNITGVVLGDETELVFGQGGLDHLRAVRDWIVGNGDAEISALLTLSSVPNDRVAELPSTQDLWTRDFNAKLPDAMVVQMYPWTQPAGIYPDNMLSNLYRDLEWYKNWSAERDVPMWVYRQAFSQDHVYAVGESERRLQTFVSLGYGVRGISDFLWGPWYGTPGTSYWDGGTTDPTPVYEQMAAINGEVRNLGKTLLQLKHARAYHMDDSSDHPTNPDAGVFHFTDSDADLPPQLRRNGQLLDVSSSSDNRLMVSVFKDNAGEEYYLVVNKEHAEATHGSQLAQTVTMTFDPSVRGVQRLRRSDGRLETLTVGGGGQVSFSLSGGSGDLFKIDNGEPFVGVERLFYEGFEGPYHAARGPLPEVLDVLDGGWISGEGTISNIFGAVGGLIVAADAGADDNAAKNHWNGGIRGNDRALPGGPVGTGRLVVQGDLTYTGLPVEQLGSPQTANLILATDGSITPLLNLQVAGGDIALEASTLGGLPASLSLSGGAGISGSNFHLLIAIDLDARTVQATISGDADFTTGPLPYSGRFAPDILAINAGSPSFGAGLATISWDNIDVALAPAPRIPGDADGNGTVDANDAAILAANWLHGDKTWGEGDFNDDGAVDEADATLLAANWTISMADATVPEPAGSVLLFLLLTARCIHTRRVSHHYTRR